MGFWVALKDWNRLQSSVLGVPLHEWPTPENWTDVQAFIGFVNFYYCFIQDFSTIAQPLFDLTQSDHAWNWGTKKQEAFEHLKMAVTTAPILVLL